MTIAFKQRPDLVERRNREDLAMLLRGAQGNQAHRQLLVTGRHSHNQSHDGRRRSASSIGDDAAIIREPFVRIIEMTAECSIRIEVQPWHTDFLDAQAQLSCLDPHLQRHAPAGFRDGQFADCLPAIRLEAAEGVGQVQAEHLVQLMGDRLIDESAIGRRRQGVLAKLAQVAAGADDVRVVDRFLQDGDTLRLMLAVTIHGHEHIAIAFVRRVVERGVAGLPRNRDFSRA